MAEAIFNALAQDRGLGIRGVSAGIAARPGTPIDRNTSAALDEIGVDPGDHRARPVESRMLEEADLVLVMEPWHAAQIRRTFDGPLEVYTLPQYVGATGENGISDPHGSTMFAHRASARQIYGYLETLMDRFAGQQPFIKP